MQRPAPIDTEGKQPEAEPAAPAAPEMIPVSQSKMHAPAPEQPAPPRRSALVVEILSFILIAFLVASALLFNLAAPGTQSSVPSGVSIQLPPKPDAEAGPPGDAADAAQPLPSSPGAAATLQEVEPQAGVEAPPTTEPVAAEVAALPPGAAPIAPGARPEEPGGAVPAPADESASLPLPAEATEVLVKRGRELLGTGDIVAARLVYERAAAGGSRAAATGVAKTYDPIFLAQTGVLGLRGDAARAALWYGKAAAAGDPEAQQRLRRLRAQFPQ